MSIAGEAIDLTTPENKVRLNNNLLRTKMKKLFLTLSLVAASSFLYKCTQVEYVETPRVEPVFSEQAQEWGELFAVTLTNTAKQIKHNKISWSDQNSVLDISKKEALKTFHQKGLQIRVSELELANARVVENLKTPSLDELIRSNDYDITSSQKKILKRIDKAIVESKSYLEFSNSLATINNEIPSLVPTEEQEYLFKITSTIHFGLESIHELVKQTVLSGTPEMGGITLAHLNLGFQVAQAESGGGSFWGCAAGIAGALAVGTAIVGAVINPPLWVLVASDWYLIAGAGSASAVAIYENC